MQGVAESADPRGQGARTSQVMVGMREVFPGRAMLGEFAAALPLEAERRAVPVRQSTVVPRILELELAAVVELRQLCSTLARARLQETVRDLTQQAKAVEGSENGLV